MARREGTGSFEDILVVIQTPEGGFWRCSGLSRFGGELGDDVGEVEEGGRKRGFVREEAIILAGFL